MVWSFLLSQLSKACAREAGVTAMRFKTSQAAKRVGFEIVGFALGLAVCGMGLESLSALALDPRPDPASTSAPQDSGKLEQNVPDDSEPYRWKAVPGSRPESGSRGQMDLGAGSQLGVGIQIPFSRPKKPKPSPSPSESPSPGPSPESRG
jgi:hypothetical protein